MSSSNDATFLEEEEIAREFRARLRARQEAARANRSSRIRGQSKKSGKAAHVERVGEESPLLSGSRDNSSSNRGRDASDGEEPEWFGYTELKELPWWKRPSVCTRVPLQTACL
jgi:hypothetical protein